MRRSSPTPWDLYTANPAPLSTIRELHKALAHGPGLPGLYKEAKEHGTVLGVVALRVGKNIYLSRQQIIAKIEGRDGRQEV
ncbi:MAG: hypothetical protein JXA57_01740 [Armatimonadetes bacterium]|nr:hypothetical protein [Armatimonadota bacterium]